MFFALIENLAVSPPVSTAVICQVRVFEAPAAKLPTDIVGLVTVKRPLWDVKLAVTLDIAL